VKYVVRPSCDLSQQSSSGFNAEEKSLQKLSPRLCVRRNIMSAWHPNEFVICPSAGTLGALMCHFRDKITICRKTAGWSACMQKKTKLMTSTTYNID
jgi:hypothetical protein